MRWLPLVVGARSRRRRAVGYSTEEIAAVATQFRGFGEVTPARLRFNVEAAWGTRTAGGGYSSLS